jgi:hypothetical protein
MHTGGSKEGAQNSHLPHSSKAINGPHSPGYIPWLTNCYNNLLLRQPLTTYQNPLLMPKKSSQSITPAKGQALAANYDTVFASMVELLESARHTAARAVNSVMTATYFEIGRLIVEL